VATYIKTAFAMTAKQTGKKFGSEWKAGDRERELATMDSCKSSEDCVQNVSD